MLASHRADINRLNSPHSSIVLELHAGEIAQSVRYGKGIQALQLSTFQGLRHDDILVQRTRRHLHLLYPEAAV